MAGEKLAELYLEIRAKGDINKTLDDLHARIQSTNKLMTGFEGNAQNLFFFKLRDAAKEATFAIKVAEAALQHTGTAAGQKELKNLYGLEGKKSLLGQKQSLAEMKTQAAYQASPEGREFLKQQLTVQKEVQKFKAGQEWQKLVSEQGRFGANLISLKDKIGDFSRSSAIGLAAATAGIAGLVAAASPETFQTFTGSIHLLSASVGQIFVPMMINVSGWLQRVAFWFHGLSGETKSNIASLALWGVGGLAAVAAGGLLIRTLAAVSIGMYSTTFATAMQSLANHGLAGSFNVAAAAAGRLLTILAGVARILALPVAITAVAAGAMHLVHNVTGANPPSAVEAGNNLLLGAIGNDNPAAHRPGASQREQMLARQYGPNWRDHLPANDPLLVGPNAAPRPPGAQAAGAGAGGNGVLLGGSFQSQSSSIEGLWKRLQQGAASISPLEAQTQQWQTEMLTLVRGIANGQGNPPPAPGGNDSLLE